MIRPKIERVIPVYPEYMHIQWSIEDPNGAAGTIEVSRSGSPEGPFQVVAADIAPDTFFYQDFDVAKGGLSQNHWYRIRVSSRLNPDEKVFSDPGSVELRPRAVGHLDGAAAGVGDVEKRGEGRRGGQVARRLAAGGGCT